MTAGFSFPTGDFKIFLSPISSTGYLPNLLEDAVHEIIYRHFRLGRESRSGSEIPALDSIDDKALWKPAKYPRQFDSRDKAESMARPAEGSSGQWLPARIPAVERAGLRAGQDRVKEDDGVGPFPAVHQVRSLAAVLQHPERPRPLVLQSPGRDQPHPVVAPISVAYSDHQDFGLRCAAHGWIQASWHGHPGAELPRARPRQVGAGCPCHVGPLTIRRRRAASGRPHCGGA
jgi:hypothetical protein